MKALLRNSLCFLVAVLFSMAGWFSNPTTAQAAESYVPLTTINDAPVPDWGNISFSNLPAVQDGGSVDVPADAVNQLGYNPSRSWQAGAGLGDVMMLGDVQDDFGLQALSLDSIAQQSGLNLGEVALSNMPLLKQQTLGSLTQAIPGLENVPLGQVKPLADLVTQNLSQVAISKLKLNDWGGQVLSAPLSAIAGNEELGNLPLDKLSLNQYSFAQIPGLTQVPLSNFQNWQTAFVNGVPGLGQVSFSQLPVNLGQYLGFIAIHDVTYGGDSAHKESRQTSTKLSITGSDRVGFHYPCSQSQGCDYIELESPLSLGATGDPTQLHGARWLRGGKGPGEQMVKGGYGVLGALNGGKEPTGRHPFGKSFKVVLTKTDESTASGQFSLYFRVCHHGMVDLGCTPYFIGPVPFLGTKEKGKVFVGLTPMTPPAGIEPPETPQEVQDLINQYDSGSSDDSSQTCQIDPSKLDATSKAVLSSLPADEMGRAAKYLPYIMRACGQAGITDSNQLAYVLATAEHESDHFNTANEYSRTMYDSCGWGEGLIQVTWCGNKQKVFQKLGLPAYGGMSDHRLQQPEIAAQALCRGMKEGWYTTNRLGQCIGGGRIDLGCARSVVNADYGTVGSGIDAKYRSFASALRSKGGGTDSSVSGILCSSTGGSASGPLNNRLAQTAKRLEGKVDTSAFGRDGCVDAVNQVLKASGSKPFSGNSTLNVMNDCQGGRCQSVAANQAMPGDIVVVDNGVDRGHVGFCLNAGCTQTLSNSSSAQKLQWRSDGWFSESYGNTGAFKRYIFRLKS